VHSRGGDDDFSYLVDTGEITEGPDITPFVGIRSERVERLMAELRGRVSHPDAATVSANVGYLIDGVFRSWSPPATPEEVLAAIHAGLERLGAYLSVERLARAWDDIAAAAADPSAGYRRVVVRILLADPPGVLAQLRAAGHEYCRRDDEVCADFRSFRRRVLALTGLASPA
jgi:hypothetical protein